MVLILEMILLSIERNIILLSYWLSLCSLSKSSLDFIIKVPLSYHFYRNIVLISAYQIDY